MKRSLLWLAGAFVLCSVALAQDVAGPISTTSLNPQQRERLNLQTVRVSTPGGTATAHAYIPESSHKMAGVVFSHSHVKYTDSTTDLLPLARRIAESGAAVIVLDGALVWPLEDRDMNRERGAFAIAALHWLLTHANIDSQRCAYVGPQFKDPANPDVFRTFNEDDGVRYSPWVPLGEPLNAGNMTVLAKPEGGVFIQQFLQERLRLGQASDGEHGARAMDIVH